MLTPPLGCDKALPAGSTLIHMNKYLLSNLPTCILWVQDVRCWKYLTIPVDIQFTQCCFPNSISSLGETYNPKKINQNTASYANFSNFSLSMLKKFDAPPSKHGISETAIFTESKMPNLHGNPHFYMCCESLGSYSHLAFLGAYTDLCSKRCSFIQK